MTSEERKRDIAVWQIEYGRLRFLCFFSFQHRLIAEAVNGNDLKIFALGKLAAKLCHIYIHGAKPGGGIAVPKLIHQLRAGKCFFGVGQ